MHTGRGRGADALSTDAKAEARDKRAKGKEIGRRATRDSEYAGQE